MNYTILIIVAIVGIALGMYIARRKATAGFIAKQMKQKAENKQKILTFVQEHGKIQNNDVGKLAGVSNATAERYLDELEKEGKLTQRPSESEVVLSQAWRMCTALSAKASFIPPRANNSTR